MFRPVKRADCCGDPEIPCQTFKCFGKGIHKELTQLYCRHKKAVCKSRRIHDMALPKYIKPIHISKCPCQFAKPADIVRLEKCSYTRTEQLAFPPVRKLLLFKEAFKKTFPMNSMNRLIRHSLFSLYSHLGAVQPPEPRVPIPKWNDEEWKKHIKTFNRLAIPKEVVETPLPDNPKKPLSSLKRYKKLALPIPRMLLQNPDWTFTQAMKNYKASERLRKIALPKYQVPKWEPGAEESTVNPDALKYKASERITNLAKPAEKRLAASELKENPFIISPNALKYKASKRIKEIAEPREYENKHIRDKPFEISKKALKAKTTPRLMKLAEPKFRREKFTFPEVRRGF